MVGLYDGSTTDQVEASRCVRVLPLPLQDGIRLGSPIHSRHASQNAPNPVPLLGFEPRPFASNPIDSGLHCPGGSVFLDSSSLNDLRKLVSDGVHKSDSIVLLATKGVLTRPWCLIELLEATRQHIPIIIVHVQGGGFDTDKARRFANGLEGEMASINPSALALLHENIGPDLHELKEACFGALDASTYNTIVFDQHASDLAMVAMMKDVVEAMARATDRKIVWIEDSKRRSVMRTESRKLCRQASSFKSRRKSSGSRLEHLQAQLKLAASRLSMAHRFSSSKLNVVNEESALFICCARHDALSHARVLRSELARSLNRGCAVGGGHNTSRFIEESDAVVVLLSDGLWTDPSAIVSPGACHKPVRQKRLRMRNRRATLIFAHAPLATVRSLVSASAPRPDYHRDDIRRVQLCSGQ